MADSVKPAEPTVPMSFEPPSISPTKVLTSSQLQTTRAEVALGGTLAAVALIALARSTKVRPVVSGLAAAFVFAILYLAFPPEIGPISAVDRRF